MTFSVTVPVTGKVMTSVFRGKGFAGLKQINNSLNFAKVFSAFGGQS